MNITRSILILMIGLTLGFGIGNRLVRNSLRISLSSNSQKEKLNRLIDYIDHEYVETVNTDSIVELTVKGILSQLDPHSTYTSNKNMAEHQERMQGDFIGIGVNYYVQNDTIAIISTIPNGPSDKAGLLSGDRILIANQDTLYGKNLKDKVIVNKLKGKKDSKVKLLVNRPQVGNLNIEVQRGVVPLKSVQASFRLTPEMGYIKIERFSETTYFEFKEALERLQESTLKKIVVDLRGNGGGYVAPALEIADEFLKTDRLIMFTKDRQKKIKNSIATSKGDFEVGKVYVLIDENSASASEILAGAIQDNDRGLIVGRRSFGKGLVQKEMELGDGSIVRLTVSKYYTPTGRSIQRPYNKGVEAYFNEYLERYDTGELQDSTKVQVNDSLAFKTPKGKIVYGGGGIIPDVYVQKISDRNLELLEFANYSGLFNRFVFTELDTNRSYYNELTQENIINLEITDVMLKQFQVYAEDKGLRFSGTSANDLCKTYIQAEMARQLFSTNLQFKILSQSDKMINRVLSFKN